MARLLHITNGLSGGVNANFELARRLAAAGHDVSFLGHVDLVDQMAAQGYDYTQVRDADRAMAELRARLDEVGQMRSLPLAYKLRRELVASRELETAVAAHKPDGLIIDLEAHHSILATRSLGLPTVLKSDWFSFVWQRGIPPLNSELGYPHTQRDKVASDVAWARVQAERVGLMTIGELHPRRLARRWAPFRYNTVMRPDLKAVAKDRGLSLRSMTTQRQWTRPHAYLDLPVLSATARELDFVTKPASNDTSIGPLVFRERTDVGFSDEERSRWHGFRTRNQANGRPLVYCAFGTILPDTSKMLERVVKAVQQRGDCDLVIGLGGRAEELSTADPNILVLEYAPQLEVLEQADAAVIHGGINSINECLHFGVPMICEQTGPFDQPGCASRVEHHGVGLRAHYPALEVSEFADLIGRLLNDTALRSRVNAMQTIVRRYEDDHIAEQAVDRMLTS